MKSFLIPSLIAACAVLSASSASAYSPGNVGRSIAADSGVVHQAQGKHHRARGCRFSHGKLICGGRGGRDHGRSNRGHGGGRKHGGGRH